MDSSSVSRSEFVALQDSVSSFEQRFAEIKSLLEGLTPLRDKTSTPVEPFSEPTLPTGTETARPAVQLDREPVANDSFQGFSQHSHQPDHFVDPQAWFSLVPEGFPVPPPTNRSLRPELFSIDTDPVLQTLLANKNYAGADEYRSLYCFGLYDEVAFQALVAVVGEVARGADPSTTTPLLEGVINTFQATLQHRRNRLAYLRLKHKADQDQDDKFLANLVRQRFLKQNYKALGSEDVNALHEIYFQRKLESQLAQAAKASCQNLLTPKSNGQQCKRNAPTKQGPQKSPETSPGPSKSSS